MPSGYEEGANQARTMALLWGQRKRPSRGPKPKLDVEKIAGVAIEVADAEGLEALSMRRIADRLGVGAMALYTYVSGRDDLVELMMETVMGEMGRPGDGAEGWRDGLERYAKESRDLYHRHPWLLQTYSTRGLVGPNQTAVLDSVLGAVSDCGLSASEIVSVVRVVEGYARSAARDSVDAARNAEATGVSDEQWLSAYAPLLYEYVDADRYPSLVSFAEEASGFEQTEDTLDSDLERFLDTFEFGLERILDGIEAFVQRRTIQSGQ